ncbi:MAG TPA: alpha/beta hydrolase [Chloroflexota bacterium]|nr:alpha/beta hydrolase [Chloroflexota bacterium]
MNEQSIYKSAAGETAVRALYNEALSHWPIPYTPLDIATRHGRTFGLSCGDVTAPPLLLLHGAGTNSAIWAGDVVVYGRSHHIIAVDLLGEAGQSAPNRPPWDSPAYAEWLLDVLDYLELPAAAVVGMSQGGWTAVKFAVAYPERVNRLGLICPGGIVPDKLSFLLRVIPLSVMGQWGSRRMVRLLYGRQPIPDGVEEIMITVTRHFKARMGVLPIFTDDELRRLTMPTLLVGGALDALRDMTKIAERLRPLLPHFSATILPDAGHVVLDSVSVIAPFLLAADAHMTPEILT